MKGLFFAIQALLSFSVLVFPAVSTSIASGSPESKGEQSAEGKHEEAVQSQQPSGDQQANANAGSAAPAPIEAIKHVERSRSSGCLVDEQALMDLKKAREEIEKQKKEILARESELKRRETAMDSEIKKLEVVRDEVNKLKGAFRSENEEKVNKLVETFETMSPKSASQLLATIDENLAIAAMSKMATPKLAKLLNLMESQKSSRLAEGLVGVARKKGGDQGVQHNFAKPDPIRVPAGSAKPEQPSGKSTEGQSVR